MGVGRMESFDDATGSWERVRRVALSPSEEPPADTDHSPCRHRVHGTQPVPRPPVVAGGSVVVVVEW